MLILFCTFQEEVFFLNKHRVKQFTYCHDFNNQLYNLCSKFLQLHITNYFCSQKCTAFLVKFCIFLKTYKTYETEAHVTLI